MCETGITRTDIVFASLTVRSLDLSTLENAGLGGNFAGSPLLADEVLDDGLRTKRTCGEWERDQWRLRVVR